MNDLRATIIPKSDQLNADDLIGRTMTIKCTKVLLSGEANQPVSLHYEGDNGKPYKPCKSMRRVLVNVWGPDGNAYAGRSMTIYRDDKVQFGGMAVGGIRISHMSHIDKPVTMALTETRANRKPFTVKPLGQETPPAQPDKAADGVRDLVARIKSAQTFNALTMIDMDAGIKKQREWLKRNRPELDALIAAAYATALEALSPPGDGWPGPDVAIPGEERVGA